MSEFLTPVRLAERIHEKTGLDTELAKKFSYEFFAIARRELKNSETFSVHKFGTFRKIWIPVSKARNPQTGEEITVPAHYRIKFIPSPAVAARINARYANLKPYPVSEEQKELAGSFGSAVLPVPEAPDPQDDAVPDSDDILDEIDDDDGNGSWISSHIKLLIILGILLFVFILCLLIRGCSKKSDASPAEKPVSQVTAPAEPAVQPAVEPAVPSVSEPSSESYKVPAGSCYHMIAQEKLGNIHLWPYVYSANASAHADPDFILSGDVITIPAVPDVAKDVSRIKDSFKQTYKAYLDIIKAEPDNPRNPIRQFRAVRVLVSGDMIYPGFIEECRNSGVSSSDIDAALAIRRNSK